MVSHPGEYRWSSYAVNAQGQTTNLLTHHPLYRSLGHDPATRQYAYRELFQSSLDKDELHAVREALNQELVPGREDFKGRVEAMLERQVRPGVPGRPRVEEE